MIRQLLVTLPLLLACANAVAKPQQTIPLVSASAKHYFRLQQIDLASPEHPYRLFIATPTTPPPPGGYPVLYLLDGNGQFPLAVNLYQPQDGPAPLVVGIGYPVTMGYPIAERTRDYTFAAPGEAFAKGGGAAAFYHFLTRQVQPLIASLYPVDSGKTTLAGHSFGGLFTLYALFQHPQAFQHYVAASPSLWWGNGSIVPAKGPLLTEPPASVTLTVGEMEEKPDSLQPMDTARRAQIAQRQQVTRARHLAERLQAEGVNSRFIVYAGKNHGSVIPDAVRQALNVAIASAPPQIAPKK